MQEALTIERIRRKFRALAPVLDERSRRHWAAAEALELAWGGVTCVAAATGLARNTITAGLRELEQQRGGATPGRGIRRAGGGRKHLEETDPGLWDALDALIDPVTRGGPESPLRWACKSNRPPARSGSRKANPRKSAFTISRTRPWAKPFPTAFTTWPTTKAGSAWGFITTRPTSRRGRSGVGGRAWAVSAFGAPANC